MENFCPNNQQTINYNQETKLDVSIIIPVYNAESRFRRCLDSILSQDFSNFECILVDDGSTDGSPSICDEYAKQDARIIVIHKKNGGVSSARNAGLEIAKGKWIVFVDIDDYLKCHHISGMLNTANQSDSIDFTICGFYEIKKTGNTEHSYQPQMYIGKEHICRMFDTTSLLTYMVPWNKMFRHSIIQEHHIRFDEKLSISEDRLFSYEYMLHIRGAAISAQVTYIHDTTDFSSLSHRAHSFSRLSYRYEKLSLSMKALLNLYSIHDEKILPFVCYDWGIFKSAVFAALEGRNIIEASRMQRHLYKTLFDISLYNSIKYKCTTFIYTKEDKLIFGSHFFFFNLYIKLRRFFFR